MNTQAKTDWRHFDFWLLGAVALLIIFGVTMIRSAVAGNIELTTETNLVERQLIFAGIGLVAVFITTAIDYHLWSSITRLLYLGTAVVLFILNVVASAVFGSARWFTLFMVNIQPSEIAKIVMILVLADFFTRHQHEMGEVRNIVRSFILSMGITVWIILQPNLSTSIVMMVIWFSMLWASGLRIKHLAIFSVSAILLIAVLAPFLISYEIPGHGPIIQPYQLDRITTFLFPDPEATYGDNYNIRQALISIGSGGLFGAGYGQGPQIQLRFLKVRWSDFIFSSLSHEFGFIGAVLVMLVLLFVIYRCIVAARKSRDTFGALIAYGVGTMIAFQTFVNIGVNLNMMPATGLTLPFISYGGSSLLSSLLGIGLVESVILRHKALEF